MKTKHWNVATIGGIFAGLTLAATPPEPILGGSAGQAMRIMVAADGSVRCSATAGFRNGEAAPPEPDKTFDLSPGQTGFVDLNLGRLAGRVGQRVELRPLVRVLGGKCSAAVEVFEVFSGRSMAYMRLFAGLGSPPEDGIPAGAKPSRPRLSAAKHSSGTGPAAGEREGVRPATGAAREVHCGAVLRRCSRQSGWTLEAGGPGAGPVRFRGCGRESPPAARSGTRHAGDGAATPGAAGRRRGSARLPCVGAGVRSAHRLDCSDRGSRVLLGMSLRR